MRFSGFVGPSYKLDSVNVDCQRCVNLYPEAIESGTGKGGQRYYLRPTPGLTRLAEVGNGPIRLIHIDSIGRIFVVSGNQLYVLSESNGSWSATLCTTNGTDAGGTFTFLTSTGSIRAASMSYLGDGTDSTTIFVDGSEHNYVFWQFDPIHVAVGTLDAAGYGYVAGATDITWIDGSFITIEGGTNKFYVSDVQSLNTDALNFSSSEGDPDLVLAIMANLRDLWIFNEKTTEIYSNTGNSDFPFERISGGFLEIGIVAKRSVAKIDGTLLWLGRSKEGYGIVVAATGFSPRKISTHAIEQAISGYDDISGATAFAYQSNGHSFYVLNFDEATWVYDLTTGLWHERSYANNGSLERHRADTHAFYSPLGVHIVGDYESNVVYKIDDSVFKDGENPITRLRTFPHLSGEMNRIFCSKLEIDMETGVGLDGGVQGSDPQVMLDWSNDGGHTWSNELWKSAGAIGEYKKRIMWRRLGSFRDRVFRMKITDPVKVTLIDAHIEVDAGVS